MLLLYRFLVLNQNSWQIIQQSSHQLNTVSSSSYLPLLLHLPSSLPDGRSTNQNTHGSDLVFFSPCTFFFIFRVNYYSKWISTMCIICILQNPTLEHYTNYKASELKATVLALDDLQLNTKSCSLTAIHEKYKLQKVLPQSLNIGEKCKVVNMCIPKYKMKFTFWRILKNLNMTIKN